MNAPLLAAESLALASAPPAGFSLDSRFTVEEGAVYLTGTQSLVRLMLDQRRADLRQGLDTAGFVCGYPGSPLGGVDHEMERGRKLLDEHRIVHLQGLNEELAATAAYGTQALHDIPGARHDGVFAMWFGKSPGVDRAADAFQHHSWRGVGRNGGVLCVAGDDPQARSTNFPSDSNAIFYKLYMPILAPGNIQEVLDLGLHGYALSRACGLWVGFKFVTDIADTAAAALVGPDRVRPVLPVVELDGAPLQPVLRNNEVGPAMLEAERRIWHGQLEIARRYAALNGINRIVLDPPAARIGVLASGKTWYDLRQALDSLGMDDAALLRHGVRLLKIGMVFPLEPDIVRRFAQGLDEVLVVEDKRPFMELFVKDILYPLAQRPQVSGKTDVQGAPLLPVHGELTPDAIAKALAARLRAHRIEPPAARCSPLLGRSPRAPIMLSTARMPYFCSGCPHNSSLKAPRDAIVGAGIGCHIMALWMPPDYGQVKGYTQMGGEGAQWVGLSHFTDTRHFFQNLGDGTFAHSGSLAIRFAVSAGTNVTYKLLYNGTIAMTGGQDIQGGMAVPDMVRMLLAEGVRRIIVTTDDLRRYPGRRIEGVEVWPRERLLEAEQALAATPGVTVLLHDQHCAAQKRRLRKRGRLEYRPVAAVINERVCEGCGDCGERSNCLSVQPVATEFGRKTRIHQSSCNQDLSCLKGDCPSFATVELPLNAAGQAAVPMARRQALPLPQVALPEPQPIVPTDRFSVVLTGIGGTGVVTVNQILGTAAFRSGLRVQTYDQTGASQKAGPVVSHLKVLPPGVDGAPTVGTASADLYLVFDPLVGVSGTNLAAASPERTVAIVSTTEVPTGQMVADKLRLYPPARQLRDALEGCTRQASNLYLDAQALAEALLGDHMASNLFLVGVAWQHGTLPIPADAIEEAIRLNGTAVQMNLQAFRWGRLQAADPQRVAAAIAAAQAVPAPPPPLHPDAAALVGRVAADGELHRLLQVRVPELIAYQGPALARRYIEAVQAIRRAEQRVAPERTELSQAVARQLYKLMAPKDEYEVARLLLDQGQRARIADGFGSAARVRWHLHPTFLRALGMRQKVALGPWFTPALQLLRWARRLRGTPLDLLARTRVRRVERALLAHYEALVAALAAQLQPQQHAAALRLMDLPDLVRGYEDVKLRSVVRYLAQLQGLAPEAGLASVALPRELAELLQPQDTQAAAAASAT